MTCPSPVPPWVIAVLLLATLLAGPRTAQDAPGRPIVPEVAPTPTPTVTAAPGPSTGFLPKSRQNPPRAVAGVATWYAYVQGQAAAGPALRALLGPSWRGTVVTVTAGGGPAVQVRLTDWCACADRPGGPTVIDLDRRDFAALAPPSRGVVQVVVHGGTAPWPSPRPA